MATPPLEQVGKYKIVDVLGEGAMGVVYRAYDQVLNRYLAIKVMNTAIGNSAQLRERFLREARAAGSLQHPNVVTIYDFGEADDHLFIAMEFVDGEDLSEIIKRRTDLPITTKLDVMIDVLNGLSYAHNRGVVHRDIKPANIRLTLENRAKLMDFGIAHLQQSELTQSGVLIGTPQYMAPEQVSGGAITTATDVFAAGSVLYEFLSYRRPFEGDTLHVIMYNIMSADPPPISDFIQKVPAALTNVLTRAMAKDPAQRYPSAVEMSQALVAARQAISPALDAATLTLRASSAPMPGPATALRTSQIQSMIEDEVAKRQKRTTWRMLGLTAIAVGATLFYLKPWQTSVIGDVDTSSLQTPLSTPPAGDGAAPPTVDSNTIPAVADADGTTGSTGATQQTTPTRTGTQAGQVAAERATTPPAETRTQTRDAAAEASARAAEAARVLAPVRSLATEARRSAESAGATVAELASGQNAFSRAESFAQQGRTGEASEQYTAATRAWNDAANAARQRAADAARQQQANVVPPTRAESVVPPPAAPVDHRPAIQQVIEAYTRAIAAEDLAAIRRVYPAITREQQDGFDRLFAIASELRASYVPRSITINGETATVPFDGEYAFHNSSTRRDVTQRVQGTITLTRDGDVWRITRVQ